MKYSWSSQQETSMLKFFIIFDRYYCHIFIFSLYPVIFHTKDFSQNAMLPCSHGVYASQYHFLLYDRPHFYLSVPCDFLMAYFYYLTFHHCSVPKHLPLTFMVLHFHGHQLYLLYTVLLEYPLFSSRNCGGKGGGDSVGRMFYSTSCM